MNTTEDSGSASPRATVAGLLHRLIAQAEREIEAGKLTVAKPGELLEAARMLLELDGGAERESSDEVGREIVERLGAEFGFGDDET
jgi:hypothetical protein